MSKRKDADGKLFIGTQVKAAEWIDCKRTSPLSKNIEAEIGIFLAGR